MENIFKLIHLETTDSTNKFLAELLKKETPNTPILVFADEQTAGRGQGRNKWFSEKGKNLTLSFYYPLGKLEASLQSVISQSISLALTELLRLNNIDNVKIKWPNDIYCGLKKIAGILIETNISGNFISSYICGLGLNVNQIDFPATIPNPTSMKLLTGKTFELVNILEQLMQLINISFGDIANGEIESVRKKYESELLFLNEQRSYVIKGTKEIATIKGISKYGELIIETTKGRKELCVPKEIEYIFD